MVRFFTKKHALIEYINKNKKDRQELNAIELFECDIDILLSREWFTDTILNYYLNILENHARLFGLKVSSIITHVSVKIGREPKESTKDRFRNFALSCDDYILFPLFVNGNHFSLIVVDNELRKIEYLDSLSVKPNMNLIKVFTQVVEEDSVKRTGNLVKYEVSFPKCPKQAGGYECGMYVCVFARNRIFGEELIVNTDDPDSHRLIIAHELLEGKILYPVNHKFE